MIRRRAFAGLPVLALPARAQAWPENRPFRCIVPFPPGGTVDTVARLLTPLMAEGLGQPIVVENRGGASGTIGTDLIAKAAPDGHSFGFVLSTHSVNPHMIPRLPFDTVADFAPVGLAGGAPVLIGAHPASPFRTMGDIVAAGRRAGQEPAFGSIGNGSTGHLTFSRLQTITGARFLHTPFRGGPAVQAAVAGTVPLVIASTVVVGPQVSGGTLRGVAVSSPERSSAHPAVPTIAEQGFPGFAVESWVGVLAPARTPAHAVARLNRELNRALEQAETRQRFAAAGMIPRPGTPEGFGA
ncbi:MAG TPA: tripartite tricarboxylate transporter substrate-binding protein, partial [Acetobacteraceae bacterium]|nr:tripartite tricarboxylate transporter substrate-binding protein [Acetobacteraceae bacterium]